MVDTEINPIVTETIHVNANSVAEDVHRVRSVLVSQPVSNSLQSQGTDPTRQGSPRRLSSQVL